MIEDQLDHLIELGTQTNTKLDTIIGLLQGGVTPIPPTPIEELIFKQVLWSASDFGDVSPTFPWRKIERPTQGTEFSNLTFVLNKMRFNKKQGSPAGYGSSCVAKNMTSIWLKKLRVKLNVTYLDNWAIYDGGCKHAFWSGSQNGTNHFFGASNGFGKCRPLFGLQSPFFTYGCDFVIEKMVPYDQEFIADFEHKTLQMLVNGQVKKVNKTAWGPFTEDIVHDVNYGFDALEFKQFQFDPTEAACPPNVAVMSHEYGQLEVYGVKV